MYKKIVFVISMVASLFAVNVNGAPVGYSINSDSGSPNADSLYTIDLLTGVDDRKGLLDTGIPFDTLPIDTEGLAFDRDGTLWGIDDATRTLFPINKLSGSINSLNKIPFPVFPPLGSNDFGMTFSCDNSLYVTSTLNPTLYRLGLDGSTQIIGSKGDLGVNISAIAANDSTTTLYGLGNGELINGATDAPNLYRIDMTTGVATMVGALGVEARGYNQAGLAFDSEGQLWAITDRRVLNQTDTGNHSDILRIDLGTGAATLVSTTVNELGFESLAIGPPPACATLTNRSKVDESDTEAIPTLNLTGRLLSILILMLAGATILRRRIS